jgi:hypothetical protein
MSIAILSPTFLNFIFLFYYFKYNLVNIYFNLNFFIYLLIIFYILINQRRLMTCTSSD